MFLGGRSHYIFDTYNKKCILKVHCIPLSVQKNIISEEPEFCQSECSGQCPHSLNSNSLLEGYLSAVFSLL